MITVAPAAHRCRIQSHRRYTASRCGLHQKHERLVRSRALVEGLGFGPRAPSSGLPPSQAFFVLVAVLDRLPLSSQSGRSILAKACLNADNVKTPRQSPSAALSRYHPLNLGIFFAAGAAKVLGRLVPCHASGRHDGHLCETGCADPHSHRALQTSVQSS